MKTPDATSEALRSEALVATGAPVLPEGHDPAAHDEAARSAAATGQTPIAVTDGDFSTPTRRTRTVTRPRGLKTLEALGLAEGAFAPPVIQADADVTPAPPPEAEPGGPADQLTPPPEGLARDIHRSSAVDEFLAALPTPVPELAAATPPPDVPLAVPVAEVPPATVTFAASALIENPASAAELRRAALEASRETALGGPRAPDGEHASDGQAGDDLGDPGDRGHRADRGDSHGEGELRQPGGSLAAVVGGWSSDPGEVHAPRASALAADPTAFDPREITAIRLAQDLGADLDLDLHLAGRFPGSHGPSDAASPLEIEVTPFHPEPLPSKAADPGHGASVDWQRRLEGIGGVDQRAELPAGPAAPALAASSLHEGAAPEAGPDPIAPEADPDPDPGPQAPSLFGVAAGERGPTPETDAIGPPDARPHSALVPAPEAELTGRDAVVGAAAAADLAESLPAPGAAVVELHVDGNGGGKPVPLPGAGAGAEASPGAPEGVEGFEEGSVEATLSPLALTLAHMAEAMQPEFGYEATDDVEFVEPPTAPPPPGEGPSPSRPRTNTPPPVPRHARGVAGERGAQLPAPSRPEVPEALAERPRRPKRSKPWFEEIFDENYLRTLPFMTPQQTLREVDFLQATLNAHAGSRVLDVGCGYGRHAIELVQRGLAVTGLDLSLPLLIRAADESQRRNLVVDFVHGDMRQMAFERQFDAAYSMLTSFGYFDEESNLRVAEGIARALKPGGRLIVDVVNRDYVVGDLPTRVWWEGDGCVVLEEVEFNFNTNRLLTHRSVVFDDGRQLDQEISLRAYSLHDLGKLLRQAGFRILEVSGSIFTRGHYFGATSRNLIVLAERRGD